MEQPPNARVRVYSSRMVKHYRICPITRGNIRI